MSQLQQYRYFKKHEKRVQKLLKKQASLTGPSPDLDLFYDLLAGYKIIEGLFHEHDTQVKTQIEQLQNRVRELEKQLSLGPENSHKPPSTSRFKKIKNQRVKSGKKPGGQKGHRGTAPELEAHPDAVVRYEPQKCRECGRPLKKVPDSEVQCWQVVDIKDGKSFVTEHQRVTKFCPDCGEMSRGDLPNESPWRHARKTFGPAVKSVALYFVGYQLVPVARTQEIMSDLFGVRLSQGTLCNFMSDVSKKLKSWEISVKSQLIRSTILHVDETGIRCAKRGDWAHVVSNEKLTLLAHHESRGAIAQKDIGVLPEYRGHLVRDGFKSYDQFDACSHSFCNAHILRELKFLSEEENLKWAAELATFLKKTLKQVHDGRKSKAFRERTIADYRAILREGFSECGFKHEWKGRPPDGFKNDYDRGKRFKVPIFKRRKLSKAMNLLVRLRDHLEQILSFALRPRVPFTNNQAERDLRMLKVKEKISGCFRGASMARDFLRFRSFISTLQKQELHLLDNIYLVHVIDI